MGFFQFVWPDTHPNVLFVKANDHEIERFFQKIERTIMRLKVIFFRRLNFNLLIVPFFMRLKVADNAFYTFDLMIEIASTKPFRRSKV